MKNRTLLLNAVGIIALATVSALVIGVLIDYTWGLSSDMPGWTGILMAFCTLCASPALIFPYWLVARRRGRRGSYGILASVVAGAAFPVLPTILTCLLGLVYGHEAVAWDRLVESAVGWLVLLAMTLGSGTLCSYVAVLLDAKFGWPRG